MSLKSILGWIGRRLMERSTFVGLATIAAVAGADELGVQIGQIGEVVGLIVGTGLVTATTSAHPSPSPT